MFSTAIAAAAILAGVLFVPSYLRTEDAPAGTSDMLAIERSSSDPVDKWIHELSDHQTDHINFHHRHLQGSDTLASTLSSKGNRPAHRPGY